MVSRRTFLLAPVAGAMGTAFPQPVRLERLTEWLGARPVSRDLGVRDCLERIRVMDPSIHAWVQVLPQQPTGNGRLLQIPFGVKDVIETKGLSTEYGSPVYNGRVGVADAAIVRELRQRGGLLLGKTETAAFAYRTPPRTRNPRDLNRTPGGSSSGSAAAVAAGMIPLAIGTQTGGSVVRPASFCGIAGFKTSYGLLSMDGVLPLAKSLDTLGFFTHTAADMLAFWEVMGRSAGRPEDFPLGAPDPMPDVEPSMATAFQNALSQLRRSGLSIRAVDITGMLAELYAAQRTVMFYEGAQFHRQRFEEYGAALADLAELVRSGLQIPVAQYQEAKRYIARCRARLAELYKVTPVIVVPAASGPAPSGVTSTGDSRMNAPWTAVGTPVISIPMPVIAGEMPLGLQLTADHGQDARVIQTAVRVERLLASK